jgi:hypothetical protein
MTLKGGTCKIYSKAQAELQNGCRHFQLIPQQRHKGQVSNMILKWKLLTYNGK